MKILRTWMKIRANFFIKIWVNITKRKSAKMPVYLQKSTTPHFNGHCTKADDISLIVTCFFFSQTSLAFKSNPMFIDMLDSFCRSLFTFLPFDIIRIWSSLPLHLFIKNSAVLMKFNDLFLRFSTSKCSYYVVFSTKHS